MEPESGKKLTQKKDRSRSYPFMSLDEALKRLANLNDNLGISGFFNRETVAVGMGYSSLNGASARAVSGMVQYGLLIREKDQYRFSEIGKLYVLPTVDGDRERTIREAALKPSLFADLHSAFQGQVLPRQFMNRLVHEFGIQQKVAPDVERIFRSTMETAGLLSANGVLSGNIDTLTKTVDAESIDATSQSVGDGPVNELSVGGFLSVNLPSGLIISYPQNLAPAFAFGRFGDKLLALDEAVTQYTSSITPSAPTEDDAGGRSRDE